MGNIKRLLIVLDGRHVSLRSDTKFEACEILVGAKALVDRLVTHAHRCGCESCRRVTPHLLAAQSGLTRIGEEADAAPASTTIVDCFGGSA